MLNNPNIITKNKSFNAFIIPLCFSNLKFHLPINYNRINGRCNSPIYPKNKFYFFLRVVVVFFVPAEAVLAGLETFASPLAKTGLPLLSLKNA